MAKLTITRFPDPRPEYDAQQSAELIRQLEDLIQQLNKFLYSRYTRGVNKKKLVF